MPIKAELPLRQNKLIFFIIQSPCPITARGWILLRFLTTFSKKFFAVKWCLSPNNMKIEISRMKLLSPIYYTADKGSDPFGYRGEDGEMLFCFELNEGQYRNFEPDKAELLRNLVFSAKAAVLAGEGETGTGQALRELPQGDYLFAQKREILSREEIIDLAGEIQSEGLWQRLEPGRTLYLRYLFEDGCFVTQLFRPYTEP